MSKLTCFVFVSVVIAFSSCFPKNMKEDMAKEFQKGFTLIYDSNFKSALNSIETHKLRSGSYPDSLSSILYISEMDRSNFNSVEYIKLENGYELNLRVKPEAMEPYPDEFWDNLGCVKSNMMNPGFIPVPAQADSTHVADSVQ